MTFRQTDGPAISAAKASISTATAYRYEHRHHLPSSRKAARGRRRPDPLVDFFDAEVVAMLAPRQLDTNLTLARDNHGEHHAQAAIKVLILIAANSHPDRRAILRRTRDPAARVSVAAGVEWEIASYGHGRLEVD